MERTDTKIPFNRNVRRSTCVVEKTGMKSSFNRNAGRSTCAVERTGMKSSLNRNAGQRSSGHKRTRKSFIGNSGNRGYNRNGSNKSSCGGTSFNSRRADTNRHWEGSTKETTLHQYIGEMKAGKTCVMRSDSSRQTPGGVQAT